MDRLLPYAIGLCGLTEEQTWTMTPGEITTKIGACDKQYDNDQRFTDMLFATTKRMYAASHGVDDPQLENYLIIPPEITEDSKMSKVDNIARKLLAWERMGPRRS